MNLLFSFIDFEGSGNNPSVLLLAIAVILLTGLLMSKLTKVLHIPNVTGYLVGGLLLGPGLLGLINGFDGIISISTVEALKVIVKIELAFIAFTIGCEFKKSFIKSVGIKPIIVAAGESFFAVIIIFGVIMCFSPLLVNLLDKTMVEVTSYALALGSIGAATAPAATLMVIKQYRAKGELTDTLIATVAVDDATALIFFGLAIAIIEIISPNSGNSNIVLSIASPFIAIILAIGLGVLCGFALVLFTKYFHGRGTRLCAILCTTLGCSGLCYAVSLGFNTLFANCGLSGNSIEVSDLFAVMVVGLIYTNFSPAEEETVELVNRFTPPFVMMFFVLSGAELDFGELNGNQIVVIVLSIACYVIARTAGKYAGVQVTGRLYKLPSKVTNLMALGLMPQGGVAIGLSITASRLPVLQDISLIISTTIITSCIITELFGPLFTKFMLYKAKEADPALK